MTVVTSDAAVAGYGNYDEYIDRLRDAGVTVYRCDSLFARDLALNLRVLELLRCRIDAEDVDVVHAHAGVPALVGRLFAGHLPSPVPVVQTQHGWGTNKTPPQEAADLAMLCDVDRVIATSGATRDLLVRRRVPAWNITVIPCGLPDAPLPSADEARRQLAPLRERGVRVIGCIGSVTPNKNQRLLVEALAALADEDMVAVFVGEDGDALMPVAAAAGVADRVLTCGYQREAARWLPLMDLLVLPSRTEGQGLAVLEAFRAGVPVVASHIPALAELISHGHDGFLFEPDNAAALAACIRAALALPTSVRDVLVAAAHRRFLDEYTLDRMVARHEALYAQVAMRVEVNS